MPIISHFTNLKELNLEENYLKSLPHDLSNILPSVENLNLNSNNFEEDNVSKILLIQIKPMINSVFINRGFPENDAKADKSLYKSA